MIPEGTACGVDLRRLRFHKHTVEKVGMGVGECLEAKMQHKIQRKGVNKSLLKVICICKYTFNSPQICIQFALLLIIID